MITLDQVQKLEKKVNDAVDLIHGLKAEKAAMEEKVLEYELRILELEETAEKLKKDQNEIEDKILGALNQLEDLDSESITPETSEELAAEKDEPKEESETSVDFSASDDQKFVIAESEEPSEMVIESENTDSESESEIDNQSELQEEITEDPQVGITAEEETVEEEEVPTVDSEFGEKPEDEEKKTDNHEVDLFEQSLDIF